MARIVGNRIVPDEIITEQDTWRTHMNPQNQWGNYGINTLGNAPFAGLQQSAFPNMADVSGEVGEYDNTSGFNLNNMDLNNPDAAIGPIINFKDAPVELNETLKGLRRNNPRYGLIDQFRNQGGDETTGFKLPSIFGAVKGGLESIKDQFEYRPATETLWDPNTGEFISAEEQDKQNALGGYYSAAAKHARKQRARVVNMLAREKAGQEYGEDNLRDLLQKGYGEKITEKVTDVVQPGKGTTYTGPKTSYFDPGIAARTQHPTERARTQGGYTDPGKDSYGPWKAEGGRIGYANGEFVEDASMMEATPAGMMEENIEEVQGEPSREQLEVIALEIFRLPLEELSEQQLMVVYQAAMEQEPSEEEVQFAAQEGPGEGIASLV